jgi:hypothetical protein
MILIRHIPNVRYFSYYNIFIRTVNNNSLFGRIELEKYV